MLWNARNATISCVSNVFENSKLKSALHADKLISNISPAFLLEE